MKATLNHNNEKIHFFDACRRMAEKVRSNKNEEWEKVIILIKNNVVQGWCSSMPDPRIEDQELIAVDAQGSVFMIFDGVWCEQDVQICFNFDELQ